MLAANVAEHRPAASTRTPGSAAALPKLPELFMAALGLQMVRRGWRGAALTCTVMCSIYVSRH